MSRRLRIVCLLHQQNYQPGDPAPEGYLAWHEWAEVQHKAGLRQQQCARCGLWRYPQELSGEVVRSGYRTSTGGVIEAHGPVCLTCAEPSEP